MASSSVASISVLSDTGEFYHRALINASGSVRLSSSCIEERAVEGYDKIIIIINLSKINIDEMKIRFYLEYEALELNPLWEFEKYLRDSLSVK